MNEYKDKIYVIGSLSREDEIKKWADYYARTGRYRVKYVKREPKKNLDHLIRKCFLNILWADRVVIIPKADGTLGSGVTYEKVFAELIGKRVETVSPEYV